MGGTHDLQLDGLALKLNGANFLPEHSSDKGTGSQDSFKVRVKACKLLQVGRAW